MIVSLNCVQEVTRLANDCIQSKHIPASFASLINDMHHCSFRYRHRFRRMPLM